jgi:uncharacterized protein (TIGR02246 family)
VRLCKGREFGRRWLCGTGAALVFALGCRAPTPTTSDASIRLGITAAIDSLFAAMESLQPERMLAAWSPGSDVLHVSNTNVIRIDTLLPALRPLWAGRRAFKGTWTLHGLRMLGPHVAVATTDIRFVATDTIGSTTERKGVWTLVLEEHDGAWRIAADHRTMTFVPSSH